MTELTRDLYTAKETSEVRKLLYQEQSGYCALSNIAVELKDCHTDHVHDATQLVRGALYKQSNMCLGKIENLSVRYLNHWYPGTLPQFLRQAADYLEKPQDNRWRHTGWIKKVNTLFNQLKEPRKDFILRHLGLAVGSNSMQRKSLFRVAVLSRRYTFNELMIILEKEKENAK